jgi:hypothetical protein
MVFAASRFCELYRSWERKLSVRRRYGRILVLLVSRYNPAYTTTSCEKGCEMNPEHEERRKIIREVDVAFEGQATGGRTG